LTLAGYDLTTQERDRRWNIVREQMTVDEISALIVHGSTATGGHGNGNLRWMTNLNHEGFLYFPLSGDPSLFGITGGKRPGWVPDEISPNPVDRVGVGQATSLDWSSLLSVWIPSLNSTPARTRATSSGLLTLRHLAWAASSSL
jgi:hypothetical protein